MQAQTDSLTLRESVLVERRNESMLEASAQGVKLQSDRLRTMPMLLGSSDPVRLARYLPSMQATSELDAGIHIQGNEHSHNLVSSGGIPIYGASHLLGIFSVFNPSHYPSMTYEARVRDANRLGGRLDMALPQETSGRTGGDFSAGLMAAQGSLHVPAGSSSVSLSLRRSYINALYGHFLTMGGKQLAYGFTDANLTWFWKASARDRIWFDAYWGNDSAGFGAGNDRYGADLDWWNAMGALHWHHAGQNGSMLRQSAYVTAYALDVLIEFSSIKAKLPSSILTSGYKASWNSPGGLSAGLDIAAHWARPQQWSVEGFYTQGAAGQPMQLGQEATLSLGYTGTWGPLTVSGGLKGLLWHGTDGRWIPNVAPDILVGADFYKAGKLELRAGISYQYLHQAGITDLGLPCEFWFLSGSLSRPQRSIGASLSYGLPLFSGGYELQAELYYRTLENQVEYADGFLDLIYSPYSLEDVLLRGRGRAYGASLMLHKKAGALTGWLSYSYGRSLRVFDEAAGEVPSSHERIHELDLVASYSLGKWTFGLTFLAAGGTPYTPATAMYLLNNRVMVQYGPHNSARLSPYSRLDVSVNYFFNRSERLENGLNFSMYNILGSRNELFRHLSMDDEGFSYSPDGINIRFMPSLCYFHKF